MKRNLVFTSVLISGLLVTGSVMADDDFNPNFIAPRSKVAPGIGRDPSELAIKTYGVNPIGLTGQDDEEGDKNNFYYTGFLRAPFNFGIGTNQTLDGEGFSGSKLHAPPVIPDSSYLDWRYTNNHGGPWAEIKFTYGNRKVSGNLSFATYNMTTGGYKNLSAQMGISDGFVSMNFPGLFNDRGGMVANVGVFSARYGNAGRYDAGMYDTYLFGATKTAGEHLRFYYDIGPKLTLHLEQGFGGMVEVAPFMQYELVDLNKSVVTNHETGAAIPNPVGAVPWAPYGGSDWAQGDTFLHHEHVGLSYDDKLFLGAHFMHEFSVDSDSFDETHGSALNGHIMNMGVDLKMVDFFFGNGYLGYAHTKLKNPLRVGGALEALHSVGGWAWNQNFFKMGSIDPNGGGTPMTNIDGLAEGTIDSVSFEYELSMAKLLWHPAEFWGQDKDVILKLFGMLNFINTPEDSERLFYKGDGTTLTKFKWGADALYTPLSWFGVGARFDAVNPDMNNSYLSFNQISGRLLFRSKFVTNETITVQYTKYLYGDDVIPGYPWNNDGENGAMKPDDHVFTIGASMWW